MGKKLIENKKDKILVTALGVLGFLFVVLLIIFIWIKIENNKYISEITNEKDSLNNELSILSEDYKNLETDNDTLKVKLDGEKEKITLLLEKMRVFRNNSYAEISKYKKEVTTLKTVLRSYVVQIDSLNRLNQALITENTKVKKQMFWAKDRANKLQKKNKNIEDKLSKAATLEASEFEIIPINKKGKRQKKLKKTDKLKAVFIIRKNITAQRGERKLYIRISRPDENLLIAENKGTFNNNNQKLEYSASRIIEFEGERLEVAIYWNNDGSLLKGKYSADLFSEDNHIGSTTFYLK